MEVLEAPKSIEPWRIVCASQSEPDYSEERYILIYANDDPREYCAGEGYILIEDGIDLFVDESAIKLTLEYMLFGSGEDIEIEYNINYCPMCGRDLGGES